MIRPFPAPLSMARLPAATTTEVVMAVREHLLWDEGFPGRLALSLAVCAAAASLPVSSPVQAALGAQLTRLAARLEWWSALGLLSSSCCLLQLLLNTLSVGCAGFNTLLGPTRPYMMAITLSLQAAMWRARAVSHASVLAAAGVTLLTAALTFLPELLHLWTARRVGARGALGSSAESTARELKVHITGMGCVACAAKVKTTVEALDGVEQCEVDLQSALATVKLREGLASPDVASGVERRMGEALRRAGFDLDKVPLA